MDIRIYDDPVLREKARPIEQVEPRHRELAREMSHAMYDQRGIGLAGNQVGVLERIIIVDVDWPDEGEDDYDKRRPMVMINPEILEASPEEDTYSEGCLSLPGIEGEVWRPTRIRYRYTDLEGATHEEEAADLEARCIQHEIDHLDGVLFIDHVDTGPRRRMAGKLAQLRKTRQAADPGDAPA